MRSVQLNIKRLADVLLSLLAIIVLLPFGVIIAILIKLSSKGPVLFTQKRLGKDGKPFSILKFRTMVVGAEKMGSGLFVYNEKDNRITKVGGFLRKFSLDELPQIFNVLIGQMSLVGPRPPVEYFPYDGYDNYPDWAKDRFLMRPGITGLSQVRIRTTAPWDQRIKVDLEYVEKFNLLLDIEIILKTVKAVVSSKSIYPEFAEQIDNS